MKIINKNIAKLIFLILISFTLTFCSKSNEDEVKTKETEKVETQVVEEENLNDTKCAECGNMFVGADGYCGKIENLSGTAKSWGYTKGSYCSETCSANSNF